MTEIDFGSHVLDIVPWEDGWLVARRHDESMHLEILDSNGSFSQLLTETRFPTNTLAVAEGRVYFNRKTAAAEEYQTILDVVSLRTDGSNEVIHALAASHQPGLIKTGDDGVYIRNFTDANPLTPSVYRIPWGSTERTALTYGIPQLYDYELTDSDVYFAHGRQGQLGQGTPGGVGRFPKEGGDPEWLFQAEEESAEGIEIGNSELYFTMGHRTRSTSRVYALNRSGGEPRELARGGPALLLLDDCLLFEQEYGVGMMSTEGENVRELAAHSESSWVNRFFLRDGSVYWLQGTSDESGFRTSLMKLEPANRP